MQLGLFQNIVNEIRKINISDFISEVSERLEKMEEELVIDRFEDNTAICEDRKTGRIIEIPRENIEENVKEGDVIKKAEGIYKKDIEKQEKIEKRIEEKMNKIWKD